MHLVFGRLEKSYYYNIRPRLIPHTFRYRFGLIWQQREGLIQQNHYNRCKRSEFHPPQVMKSFQHFNWLKCTLKLLRWPRTNLWQHLEITIFEDQEAFEIYDTFRWRPIKSWVKGDRWCWINRDVPAMFHPWIWRSCRWESVEKLNAS